MRTSTSRASRETASLAAKTPGFDDARLSSLASEGVNARIAQSVKRVSASADGAVPAVDVKDAPIKMLRSGEGVQSKSDAAVVPERPSAASRLDLSSVEGRRIGA